MTWVSERSGSASRGMWCIDHQAPTSAARVAAMTRYRLVALKRMIALTMAYWPPPRAWSEARSRDSESTRKVARVTIRSPPASPSRISIWLAVAGPEADHPRLELAALHGHEDHAPGAGVDDGVGGDAQRLPRLGPQHDLAEHLRLERCARVGEGDADLGGAGLGVEDGVDEGHLPLVRLPREGLQGEGGRRPDPHVLQLRLVDVGQHPDRGEVPDLVGRGPGLEARAGDDLLLGHHAAGGGVHHHGALRLPGLLEPGHGGGRDVPQLELAAGRRHERVAVGGEGLAPGARAPVAAEGPAGRVGEEELLLGGQELRAVDGEERVAPPHRPAHEVGLDRLDEAAELDVDAVDARLVDRHAADGPEGAADGALRQPWR